MSTPKPPTPRAQQRADRDAEMAAIRTLIEAARPAGGAYTFSDISAYGRAVEPLIEVHHRLQACKVDGSARNAGLESLKQDYRDLLAKFTKRAGAFEQFSAPILYAPTPWHAGEVKLTAAPGCTFVQGLLWPNSTGVCNTLANMYIDLRTCGHAPKAVLKMLADATCRAEIKKLHGTAAQLSASDRSASLRTARAFQQAHAFCQARWPGAGFCPTLRPVGSFPEGFLHYMQRGRHQFAIRARDGRALMLRDPPTAQRLRTPAVYLAEQKRAPAGGITRLLLEHTEKSFPSAPLTKIEIYQAGELGKQVDSHAVALDEDAGLIFDPNLGLIPVTQGLNSSLGAVLHKLGAAYQATGMVAYQCMQTSRRCSCAKRLPT